MPPDGVSSISAVLGPTNTGKTHRAVERMLEHQTGMIGLPLRLLAREVYDRLTTRVGERDVALVTGEEKRVPARPRYWVCTVEAMPLVREVDFVAIDEVQLASHPERGHVFTDRLLNARGVRETWFLGSETARLLIERLVPAARFKSHPRLSRLTAAGRSSLQALPARSAVVAFSAARVYEIAARLREHKGGAAVVLGALSPRARNAQVALYQAGEVDYVVATDAIGMGLNLDVLHVAFADLKKFDGRETRPLEPAELAQIAGRAGRYLTHGTFGTLAPLEQLSESTARAIETHRFSTQTSAWWRNSDLDYSSLETLLDSLRRRPRLGFLRMMDRAEDQAALVELAKDAEVRKRAANAASVALLWSVCGVPDFRGLLLDAHVEMLSEVFAQLTGPREQLETDWLEARVKRVANLEGDIDTLLMRMAGIRTFTYMAHQHGWVPDAEHWQARTKEIEDALSDALHRQLVARFVDHNRSVTRSARPRPSTATRPEPEARSGSENPFAKLAALRDALSRRGSDHRATTADGEGAWLEALIDAAHGRFRMDAQGKIYDGEVPIGRLKRGQDWLCPEVTVTLDDLGSGARSRVQRRLVAWTRDLVAEMLSPLRHESLEALSPAARGFVYRLERSLGTVFGALARSAFALPRQDRRLLQCTGVRLHRSVAYLPALLSEEAVAQRVALWRAFHGSAPEVAPKASFAIAPHTNRDACAAVGYPALGPRAVRADVVAKVAAILGDEQRRSAEPFTLPESVADRMECPAAELPAVLRALGYRSAAGERFVRAGRRRKRRSERGSERLDRGATLK